VRYCVACAGDGVIGGDITHLIRYIIPRHVQHAPPAGFVGSTLAIRGEIIISKQSFAEVAGLASTARSLTNGLVNRKSVDPHMVRKVDFVAYEVISPRQDKASQMQLLSKSGFKTVNCTFMDNLSDQALAEQLELRRRDSHYELDGLVVESNGPHDHSGTGNPAFAFAFKKPASEQGTHSKVIAVLWSPSKAGLLKPRVQYEPIQLEGVVMQFATAHNAGYVLDNMIGPGAVVEVVRSGDVVPQIVKVITPATDAQMPDMPYTWSKTGVDAVLENPDKNEAVQIRRLIKFFSEMSISDISQGLITRFWDHGFQHLNSYLDASIDDFIQLPGVELALATKLHTNIQTAVQSAPLVTVMKASNSFPGGIGRRKLEAILTQVPDLLAMTGSRDDQLQALVNVDGVQEATAEKVLLGIQQFKQFLQNHPRIVVKDARAVPAFAKGPSRLSEMTVVFTGVRDRELAAEISELGGRVTTAMSSKTTVLIVKDAQAVSSKIQKAQKMGIKVMDLQAFKDFVSQSH